MPCTLDADATSDWCCVVWQDACTLGQARQATSTQPCVQHNRGRGRSNRSPSSTAARTRAVSAGCPCLCRHWWHTPQMPGPRQHPCGSAHMTHVIVSAAGVEAALLCLACQNRWAGSYRNTWHHMQHLSRWKGWQRSGDHTRRMQVAMQGTDGAWHSITGSMLPSVQQ